jgi:hypothetical protein
MGYPVSAVLRRGLCTTSDLRYCLLSNLDDPNYSLTEAVRVSPRIRLITRHTFRCRVPSSTEARGFGHHADRGRNARHPCPIRLLIR